MKVCIAKAASFESADFVIAGMPTDLGASKLPAYLGSMPHRLGRVDAPAKVRKLSENWFIPFDGKLDERRIYDAGDLKLSAKDIFGNIEAISGFSEGVFRKNQVLVAIGGDCSIKSGILSGLDSTGKKTSVVYLDSHPDLVVSKKPWFGSAMADCLGLKNVDFSRSVFVGAREIEDCEMDLIRQKKAALITPFDIRDSSIDAVFGKIKRITKGNQVYVSVDLDCVDPAFAPAVGCVAPGGLSSTELLSLISKLKTLNPAGLDVTEFIPRYDVNDMTGKLVFRLIHEFMAR